MGRHERMSFQMIIDQVTGTTPTALLQQQTSSDNRNWIDKQTAEIPATTIVPTATNILNGYELGTNPSHGFMRLKIVLGGTSPQAHVKVWVTGRDLL